jgi:hypothetical protein
MFGNFRTFLHDTDGAVTVDWVVLTAGVVALAIFILSPFGLAPTGIAESVTEGMDSATDRFFAGDFGAGD